MFGSPAAVVTVQRIGPLEQSRPKPNQRQIVTLYEDTDSWEVAVLALPPLRYALLQRATSWFHITMRMTTVLQQQTKTLQAERPKEVSAASKQIESIRQLLWHGNVEAALERIDRLLIDLKLISRQSAPADKLAAGISDLRTYIRNNQGSIQLRGAIPAGENYQHGVCGVDDQSGGEPPVCEEAADAVDAERSALAVTDADEGPH
jgi:hypothetical protein